MTLSRTSPSRGPDSAEVIGFYDDDTGSIQYLAIDPWTRRGALIDVVQGFDPGAASISTDGAEAILRLAETEGVQIDRVLDTHPHADHLMASAWLAERLDAPNGIGAKVSDIAELWRDHYNMPDAFAPDRDFAHLYEDGNSFEVGALPVRVMLTPGHTLGSVTYVIGNDAAFVHDTFMMPDTGTARADFPGGDAGRLYDSLRAILELPDDTRLFVGHDYGTETRKEPAWEATVLEQRRHNVHIGGGVDRADYVELRNKRDKTLSLPDRMLHVLQMNLRAGRTPKPEHKGRAFLKIPLDRF